MNHRLNSEHRSLSNFTSKLLAGGTASLITQPFEVLKTHMIASSSNYIKEIHFSIIKKGWSQYMRGCSLAVIRQAYGFTIYTHLIQTFNKKIETDFLFMNKFFRYSFSATSAKFIAMIFESPLTIMKTRLEANSSSTIKQQLKKILQNPLKQVKIGIGSTLAREGVYSFFHYNTYRFLKDDIFKNKFSLDTAFFPAFFAGIIAITMSQPFEVIRSKLVLSKQRIPNSKILLQNLQKSGWRSFFIGFLPRLIRKPINSGICWTIVDNLKSVE